MSLMMRFVPSKAMHACINSLKQAAFHAQCCTEQYQDVEDQVAREAMDAALSQINEGRLSMTRCMPSFIKAVQQEKAQAEEEWVCLQDTMIL
jgi:hypothetical protein